MFGSLLVQIFARLADFVLISCSFVIAPKALSVAGGGTTFSLKTTHRFGMLQTWYTIAGGARRLFVLFMHV